MQKMQQQDLEDGEIHQNENQQIQNSIKKLYTAQKQGPQGFQQVMDPSIYDSLQIQDNEKCCICKGDKAKYRCPGCEKRSCSLVCSKQHKSAYNCSGNRDPTKMVSVSQYTEKVAQSDYQFLSNVILGTEIIEKRLAGTNALQDALRYKLLRQQARRQCGVDVRLAPKILEIHRDNISFYSCQDRVIYWCIEARVFLGNNKENKYYKKQLDPMSNNITLKEIFQKSDLFSNDILQKHGINLKSENIINLCQKGEMAVYYPYERVVTYQEQEEYRVKNQIQQMENFKRKGQNQIKDAPMKRSSGEYVKLELFQKLNDIVKGSTIYEYPVLILVLKKFDREFKL